ncbi:GNAT family N-acetyltransferase [Mucilaginibacter sp. HMF5004]|uniref:GNAT family N-acetyltransferase n=1 Tax=Mucilaginibacter rivuli TaxID=2857527 RepID=UPI001C5EB755|nr:GNAT family N-acetyltransferase [Mucilaginibacter rivuli]MBW4891618.1 GNAT family N-acetyltransferase [Mucilaginibacter rivuli]
MNINFSPFPVLKTNRVTLRELVFDDAQQIMLLRSDPQVNKFLGRVPAITMDDAYAFIEKIGKAIIDNRSMYWAINLNNDNTLVGTICLWNLNYELDMAEIGFELNTTFQGKGIMAEAIKQVIDYGFGQMELKVITALTVKENERSINTLLKHRFLLDADHSFVTESEADGLLVYYLANY